MGTPGAELGKKMEGESVYIMSQACHSGVLMTGGRDGNNRAGAQAREVT